jgi:hypothetical protein
MKTLETAKYATMFLIGLTIIIALVKLSEKNLKLSISDILILLLLLSISLGIYFIIQFIEEVDSTGIVKTLNDISTKGILGSLVK